MENIDYSSLGYAAARSANLEMVKFIEQYHPLQQYYIGGTAYSGSIDILQYYLNKGFNVTEDPTLCQTAMNNNHLEFVKIAIKNGAVMTENLLASVVRANDLELVKLMRSKGCK